MISLRPRLTQYLQVITYITYKTFVEHAWLCSLTQISVKLCPNFGLDRDQLNQSDRLGRATIYYIYTH